MNEMSWTPLGPPQPPPTPVPPPMPVAFSGSRGEFFDLAKRGAALELVTLGRLRALDPRQSPRNKGGGHQVQRVPEVLLRFARQALSTRHAARHFERRGAGVDRELNDAIREFYRGQRDVDCSPDRGWIDQLFKRHHLSQRLADLAKSVRPDPSDIDELLIGGRPNLCKCCEVRASQKIVMRKVRRDDITLRNRLRRSCFLRETGSIGLWRCFLPSLI